jgi:type IV pilus assembly protein PilW
MHYRNDNNTTRSRGSQSGFSLVELMVASTIGLAMLAPVLGLFLSSKRSYNENDRISAVVDNGRYALSALSDELREVDFWGPTVASAVSQRVDLDAIATDCVGNGAGYTFTTSLWATTATAATVVDAICITNAAINSDVIFVKHVAGISTPVVAGRTYILANEAKGILFDGADTAPTTINGGDVPGGTAWEYQASVYYVNNANPPELVRRQLISNTWSASTEVAVGIERIQLMLGVDNGVDSVADAYVNAAGVTNWDRVVSARIFVLARSVDADPFNADTRTYALGGVTYDPNPDDNFVRMLLESSVSMRNRQLQITGGR